MIIMKKTSLLACLAALIATFGAQATEINDSTSAKIQKLVQALVPEHMGIGTPKANAIDVVDDSIKVDLSENFGDVPFTRESINQLKNDIKSTLGEQYQSNNVYITIASNSIENYFSDFETSYQRKHNAFITPLDENRHYSKGLDGNIVAVWPSHGWYFEPYLNRWEWQRARLFHTVEDM